MSTQEPRELPPPGRVRWEVVLVIAVPAIYVGMILYLFSRRLAEKWMQFIGKVLEKVAVEHY